MKPKKNEIEIIVLKLMDDIGRDYFKNEEISIEFVENLKVPGLEKKNYQIWMSYWRAS